MKIPKLDYAGILKQTAGEAGGLFALGMVAKNAKVAAAKPGMKGAIYKAIGILGKALVSGGKIKKGNQIVDGAASAFSVAGTSQLMDAFMPGKVAVIGGYEDNVINGIDFDEAGDGEDSPNAVAGYEENIMQ